MNNEKGVQKLFYLDVRRNTVVKQHVHCLRALVKRFKL
jgi:hypothetical protein